MRADGKWIRLESALLSAAVTSVAVTNASAESTACLITKTDTNPFFAKMKEGALAAAKTNNMELLTYAGKIDGDVASQVAAVETCMSAGAKGILITPSDSRALAPVINQARQFGALVIALDTPFEPADTADATFATDNFKAGKLVGEWARAKLGADADKARIAMLDLNPSKVSVDYLRHNGFLTGFGIEVKNPTDMGGDGDPRVVGRDVTNGNEEGGRQAMENLLQIDPEINVVYTINEPAAAGAYEALKAVGREKETLIVSVDGGCPGVENVKAGVIGATSMQFPLLMAAKGIEAIKAFVADGTKPENSAGLDFVDTGVNLIANEQVKGIESMSAEEGLKKCWG